MIAIQAVDCQPQSRITILEEMIGALIEPIVGPKIGNAALTQCFWRTLAGVCPAFWQVCGLVCALVLYLMCARLGDSFG